MHARDEGGEGDQEREDQEVWGHGGAGQRDPRVVFPSAPQAHRGVPRGHPRERVRLHLHGAGRQAQLAPPRGRRRGLVARQGRPGVRTAAGEGTALPARLRPGPPGCEAAQRGGQRGCVAGQTRGLRPCHLHRGRAPGPLRHHPLHPAGGHGQRALRPRRLGHLGLGCHLAGDCMWHWKDEAGVALGHRRGSGCRACSAVAGRLWEYQNGAPHLAGRAVARRQAPALRALRPHRRRPGGRAPAQAAASVRPPLASHEWA
mmetsp:Transcript_20291/g.56575  ORF Transcript_20291/g.56575 Transcript_20291/m.56575 type:complete len:259 (-) Transcript_20291:6-782(-)